MPKRHFMSVDLPAPFSPMRAWTEPGRTRTVTSSSALTPGKLLEIPSISKTYSRSAMEAPPIFRADEMRGARLVGARPENRPPPEGGRSARRGRPGAGLDASNLLLEVLVVVLRDHLI